MLTRTTYLRRMRTAPRREPDITCSRLICRKPPRYFTWCKSHAIEVADGLFRELIRRRDRFCQECGARSRLEVAHLQPRGKFATRWDSQNAALLCWEHHLYFTAEPEEWTAWCRARLGAEIWELLTLQANVGGMPDLEVVITELRRLLRSFE